MGNKEKFITYMWREAPFLRDDKIWRYQTNDPDVNKRMRQRSDFKLVCYGINIRLWVYRSRKNSTKDAKKTLGRITRRKIHFDAVNGEFFSDSGAIVAPKSESEV